MANVEAVLLDLRRAAAECGPAAFPSGLGRLDERLARAADADMAGLLAGVLGALGRAAPHGTPDGFRETGADTLFGHVSFACAATAAPPS